MELSDRLAKAHEALSRQVDDLDRKLTLTMAEQFLLRKLKKQKLALKDALTRATEVTGEARASARPRRQSA